MSDLFNKDILDFASGINMPNYDESSEEEEGTSLLYNKFDEIREMRKKPDPPEDRKSSSQEVQDILNSKHKCDDPFCLLNESDDETPKPKAKSVLAPLLTRDQANLDGYGSEEEDEVPNPSFDDSDDEDMDEFVDDFVQVLVMVLAMGQLAAFMSRVRDARR